MFLKYGVNNRCPTEKNVDVGRCRGWQQIGCQTDSSQQAATQSIDHRAGVGLVGHTTESRTVSTVARIAQDQHLLWISYNTFNIANVSIN